MKLYTRKGDDGGTALFSGRRAEKWDARVAAVGDLDELSAAIGLARLADPASARELHRIQNEIYGISAALSAEGRHDNLAPGADAVLRLEALIDEITDRLPVLRDFIIPGRAEASARLHLARSIARRAERGIAALDAPAPAPAVLAYINRLSDLLFAMARDADHREGLGDAELRSAADEEASY
jgi:cob(I)alamin adenosyltransferase